jgi:hypothetical protein
MEFDAELRPIPNLGDAGTDRSKRSTAGKSAASTTGASGTGASDSNASTDRTAGDDSTSGRSGSDAVGTDELPVGTAADDPRARRKRGRKPESGTDTSGDGRRRSNSSGADSTDTAGKQATENETGTVRETPPRVVDFDSLSGSVKTTAKNTHLTKEFIAEGWGLLFAGCGIALRDKETWSLDEDAEAKELADRTLDWFRSIDKKKSAVWEKRIAAWQPFLMLLFALVAVLTPRIAATRGKRRVDISPKTAATSSGNPGPTAPTTGTNNTVPIESGTGQPSNGRINFRERPFRNQDFQEFPDWNES